MSQVTFTALRQVLLGLGFAVRSIPDSRIWFTHSDSDTRILLPPFRDDETVDHNNIAAIRRLLDEKGLMNRERFDELLHEQPLVG